MIKFLRFRAALPISLPVAAHRMAECQANCSMCKSAVIETPMVLKPGGMRGIPVEVTRADMMVLTADHQAEAS